MGIVDNIMHPKSFLGLTDIKTGALIISVVDLLLTLCNSSKISGYGLTFGGLIALVCTGLGVWGIMKDKPSFVRIYEIYLIVNAIFAIIIFILSFITFSLTFIITSFIMFIIALYACCVVRAHYHQMGNGASDAAAKV